MRHATHLRLDCLAILTALAAALGCAAGEIQAPNEAVLWNGVQIGTGGPNNCTPGEYIRAGSSAIRGSEPMRPSLTSSTNCNAVLELWCPWSVNWGSSASCFVIVEPQNVPYSVDWRSTGPNGEFLTQQLASGGEWGGPLIVSTTVRATVHIDGGQTYLAAPIFVASRPALSWANSVSGSAAAGTEIDGCFDPDFGGLTASAECATASDQAKLFIPADPASGTFFHAQSVPYGPNQGLMFVSAPSVTMTLLKAIARKYRADGNQHPVDGSVVAQGCLNAYGNVSPRNHHQVNILCTATYTYTSMLSHISAHEQSHIDIALEAARSAQGDLHARLSQIVTNNYGSLKSQAIFIYDDAHQFVHTRSLAIDNTTTLYPFWIYAYALGNGWSYRLIHMN